MNTEARSNPGFPDSTFHKCQIVPDFYQLQPLFCSRLCELSVVCLSIPSASSDRSHPLVVSVVKVSHARFVLIVDKSTFTFMPLGLLYKKNSQMIFHIGGDNSIGLHPKILKSLTSLQSFVQSVQKIILTNIFCSAYKNTHLSHHLCCFGIKSPDQALRYDVIRVLLCRALKTVIGCF